MIASTLSQTQSRIASALLAHNPSAAEAAAQTMRTMTIADPKLRMAVDGYAQAIIGISIRERQISDIDKEVLGTEGRLIQRVTELLREVSARRGHVLSRDFARTLTEARWQSIVLGTAGVLIGLFAALLVVRRTVRPLASIATSIRAVAGGEKNTSIPATDVDNEIGDIARAAEVFRQTLVDADAAREAAVRALAEQRLAEESYRKLFEASVDGIYVTTPGGALLNANPALARMMGYATPQDLINGIGDVAEAVYLSPGGAGGIRAADAARRHGPRVRIPGSRARRCGALALRQRQRRAQRGRRDRPLRRHGARHHRPEARRGCDRRRPPAAADGDRHRARGHQRQGQEPAIRADEPLHGRHFRHRACRMRSAAPRRT